jgi:putative endonuclease
MYYFYILQCADDKRYYGYTNDLKRRLKEHQRGKNISTKRRRPLKVVYYETFDSKDSAEAREKKFKGGRTRKAKIEKLINEFPPELLAEFHP